MSDNVDEMMKARAYYGNNYSGLEDDFETADPDALVEWVYGKVMHGLYVEAEGERYSPDKLTFLMESGYEFCEPSDLYLIKEGNDDYIKAADLDFYCEKGAKRTGLSFEVYKDCFMEILSTLKKPELITDSAVKHKNFLNHKKDNERGEI